MNLTQTAIESARACFRTLENRNRRSAEPGTSLARAFAIALAAAFACQPATGEGFAPESLAVPSTITYDGTSDDVDDGETYSVSGSVTTTSATTFTGTMDDEDVTGTFSYTKNGPNTAGRSYTATTSGPGYWYSESGTFNLTFTSATAGTYTASGTYQGDYHGMPFSGSFINGVGTFTYSVPGTVIVVEQPAGTNIPNGGSKDFGPVNLGSSSPLTFTIKNTGATNLTGLAITKDGTHAADFSVGSMEATTVAPGSSTTFTVTFTPGASGSRSAILRIASNDPVVNPFEFGLSGYGLDPSQTVAAAIDLPGVAVTHGGEAEWFWQNEVTHDGVAAARSGPITHNQSSSFSITATGPATVGFWWKVSSEEDFDYLRFFINDAAQEKISGEVDWTYRSHKLAAGTHTLRWSYTKDSSVSDGTDCGWVDEVSIAPDAPPVDPSELVAPRIALVGGNIEFMIEQTVSGRRYQLQQSDTLAPGSWVDVETERLGDGAPLVITIPRDSGVPKRFYRLALDPMPTAPDEFALIPAGEFLMGDQSDPPVGWSDELPVHTVFVSEFFMATHEVTKELWDEVRAWGLTNGYTDLPAGNGSYASKGANHPVHSINWYAMVKWCNARSEMEGLVPCYTVSGALYKTGSNDAVDCNWHANGYRLPTEAEWEMAARGGVAGKNFPWGTDTINHSNANYRANGSAYSYDTSPYTSYTYHPTYAVGDWPYSSPVGSFAPNGYGLYDMAGNVWEWCWDWWGSYAAGAQTDPRGPATGSYRVIRGGSWSGNAGSTRCAFRGYDWPDNALYVIGFRLARGQP